VLKVAERRMFAKTIIDSDAFLDMPVTAQLLYFHLAMRADDDGFVNKPKSIMRMTGCKDDDINLLFLKKFLIPFESGIVVIKHWKIHNYIAKDRYKETKYKNEKATLALDENNSYTTCIQTGDETDTQDRLGKDRLSKDSINIKILPPPDEPEPSPKPKPTKHKHGEYNNVLLTDEELEKLKDEYFDYEERIERLSSYIASKGVKYKSHYATIRNWARKDKQPTPVREKPQNSTDAFFGELQRLYDEEI
jgi:hypothetical protein